MGNQDLEKGFQEILDGNKNWMEFVANDTTGRFEQLAKGQNPEVLWIGCADSRVPANELTGKNLDKYLFTVTSPTYVYTRI